MSICEGTLNGEQHMLQSRQHIFREGPVLFQQDKAKPHITTASVCNKRVLVLNRLQSTPVTRCTHLAHYETKHNKKKPLTAEQLKS